MRKITLLLFALLFSFVGYSQFPTPGTEGFENTTGLDLPLPASTSPWTLGTGAVGNQWAVFDNGVTGGTGTSQKRWDRTTSNFFAGTQAAFINRKQNGAAGVISEDYLVTPKVTVPANGQLTFNTRIGFNSVDDVNYLIKINTITTTGSQTTLANYTNTVQTWNNANPLVTTFNIYELKTVNLSAYAGQQVYIAFVRVFNQPTAALGGNSWYVDDVKLVQQCLAPTNQTATGITQTTANLSWTNPSGSTSWEIEVIPVTGTPTGAGTIYNGALPYVATGLTPATGYAYYVRSRCTDSNSVWVGPFNFTTVTPGLTCATATIIPPTLPYNTNDTTANYSDTTDVAQPSACAGTATNYMTGNDVFYSYTAATTGAISISMTPGGTNSGIFVYQGCANVGVTCLAGVANTGTGVRTIPSLNVTAGQTYIIVLSSISTTQTYSYNLLIQQLNCVPPTALAVSTITANSADLSWTSPTSTSWEYVVQTAGSAVPSGVGTQTSSNTLTTAGGLNPDTAYQYWVRADCGNGTFSPWTGPFLFTTAVAPPVCGGQFIDAGGQAGNYANNSNLTYPICPTTAGNQVTVTFTAFNTQAGNDLLKVYDGNGVTGTLLATYSGTTIPAPITSSSPDGCLTFVFTSNATTPAAGWVANVTCTPAPGCQKPTVLTAPTVLYNSVQLAWTQPANPDTSIPTAWEIVALPCGSPAPTATATGVIAAATNLFTVPGLNPLTCYDFYVRAVCSTTSSSTWTGPVTASTPIAPPICGGNFVDTGGISGSYANNANYSTPICPTNPGDQVTVTFTAFNTQLNNDFLSVYDGNGTTGTLLGTFSGTALPPVITSSSPDGCLTFVFTSSASTTASGWLANVTCAPAPTCQKPILLTAPATTVLYNSVTLNWIQPANPDTSVATAWEVVALPCGSPAPTASTTPVISATSNPFIVTGLTPLTCYNFYVRAVCSTTNTSSWTGPVTATTPIAPPICGGNFVDPGGLTGNYANNITAATGTTTISPVTPGDQVTVTFTAFNTQINTDLLQVYDGIGTTGTLLATFSGTTIPQPITSSSPNGSLTFVFTSNASTNASGWVANVTCAPAPPCQKPVVLTAPATTVLYNSVTLNWIQPANPDTSVPTAWEVVALPCGSPAPTASTTPVITATTNPFTVTGLAPLTCYNFYVRAVCSTTSTSSWTGPVSATTPISPPICGGNFVDPGGLTGNYANNITAATGTTTISPVTPGDQVTVTFTAFNTQLNTDLLQVYDGIGTSGTLLATYSGTTIPQPITSSSPEGSLTFVFTSNANTPASGWLANITCSPAPACQKPIVLTIPTATVLYNSVTLGWVQPANPDTSVATAWEVVALPCGSPAPTASTTPVLTTSTNPFNITGLAISTCYDFYVRAVCSTTSSSSWSGPKSVSTVTCTVPTGVIAASTSGTTASVSWTETGSATQWEIIYLPAGSPAPGLASTGVTVNTNPAILNGLTVGTFYDVYVRAHCTLTDVSPWSNSSILYINPPLPSCAGVNLNLTTTSPGVLDICPDNNCVSLAATFTDSFNTNAYNVFSTPYSPPFPFTGGTQVSVNTDDVWSGNLTIPFKFCFYGNVYNALNIGSNGVVTFDTHAAGSNCPWAFTAPIPNTAFPIRNAIYAPYQDIDPNVTTAPALPNINYQVLGVAPCRVFVINFSKVAQFSCGVTVGLQTSQVVLYETSNVIDIYVQDRTSCTNWNSGNGVIGIQNGAGTNAVVPPGRNTGPWTAHNEAWRFLPSGASNVTFQWLQDGAPYTTNLTANVCVTQDTNMTAQATYTACDGTQVVKSETILLNLITPVTPAFTQIQPLCQGVTAPLLPTTSNDTPVAITGVWSPATIDTSVPGTVTYTFTPTAGQCANVTTMDVTVNNGIIPLFTTPAPICSGTTAPILPTSSNNLPVAITGTWSPAIVSNTASGTYTFTPDAGQCASTVTLDVTVSNNCSLGSYASAVWLTNCSTSNFFNTVGSGTGIIGPIGNVFPNSNLGTYVQNSNTFILRGAALKTFKSPTGNVCSTRLNYRIYPAASTPGTFQIMDLPLLEDCASGNFPSGGTCNPGDQKWQRIVADGTTTPYSPVNLTNYAPGNYVMQVYYDISGSTTSLTGCDENVLIDNNGAYFTATFTIQAQPTFSSTNPNTCTGNAGTITISNLTANGAYQVSYNNGTTPVGPLNLSATSAGEIILAGLNAGTYSNFSVTLNSCVFTYVTPIVLIDSTIPTVTVNSPSVCIGQTATITATPGTLGTYSYTWTVPTGATNPGNVATFNPTISGSYCVVITNTTTGCSSSCIPGTVTINPLPTVTVNNPTPVCVGQNAALNATPGALGTYTYAWTVPSGSNPGNVASFNATVSGSYSVTVTNALGCTSTAANTTVTLIPIPVVTVSDATICQGTIATVTATPVASGTYSYAWTVPSGTNPGNVASFTTSIAGVYSVVITNTTTGCSSLSDSGTVSFVPAFDFVLNGECLNSNFILEVIPSGNSFDLNTASFNWTLNSITVGTNATFDASAYFHDPAVTSQLPVTFDVNVTTTDGCQLSHSILVNRIYCEIQKGISPNNDTKNEFFDLRLMNVDQLEIFNRYGTKVYSKSDYTNQWIGQSDAGNELPDGTYFYVIQFKNNQPSTTGWIYINRDSK
ncbi:MAG: fibronectin type III domain-containing protein [Flavobacterium sp.]